MPSLSFKTRILNQFRKFFILPVAEQQLLKLVLNTKTSQLKKLIPPNYLYNEGTIRNIIRDDIKYETDLSDYVEHSIFWGLTDDGHKLLYRYIKPGSTIFDVGANIGDTALHFSKLTDTSGKVFAFEPDPVNYVKLKTNIARNDFNNIEALNFGLGRINSIEKLYKVEPGNKGMNRILNQPEAKGAYTKITIRTIDEFVSEQKLNNLDVIKIDVEGFEFSVLQGATNTIEKFKPILFIEIDELNLNNNGTSANELFGFVSNIGYSIQNAQTGLTLTPEVKMPGDAHFDALCTIK